MAVQLSFHASCGHAARAPHAQSLFTSSSTHSSLAESIFKPVYRMIAQLWSWKSALEDVLLDLLADLGWGMAFFWQPVDVVLLIGKRMPDKSPRWAYIVLIVVGSFYIALMAQMGWAPKPYGLGLKGRLGRVVQIIYKCLFTIANGRQLRNAQKAAFVNISEARAWFGDLKASGRGQPERQPSDSEARR